VAHNLAYFTLKPSQFILFKVPTAPTTTHGEARLIQSSRSERQLKNYLKWWETLLLVSYILDDIKGKEMVYIV